MDVISALCQTSPNTTLLFGSPVPYKKTGTQLNSRLESFTRDEKTLWLVPKPSSAAGRTSRPESTISKMHYEFTEWEQEPEPEASSSRIGGPPRKVTGIGILDPPLPPKRQSPLLPL